MHLCEESIIALERLIPKQTMIYDDAADVGIVVQDAPGDRRNEAERVQVRRVVKDLLESGTLRKHKDSAPGQPNAKHRNVEWKFFVPIEVDWYKGAKVHVGYAISISFHKQHNFEFITLDMRRDYE